jgi:hypothetical protein
MKKENPIQPQIIDGKVIRFKENKIVSYLYNLCESKGICGLNNLCIMNFDKDDMEQFYQLLGYSVCGFWDLSNVRKKIKDKSEVEFKELKKKLLNNKVK